MLQGGCWRGGKRSGGLREGETSEGDEEKQRWRGFRVLCPVGVLTCFLSLTFLLSSLSH